MVLTSSEVDRALNGIRTQTAIGVRDRAMLELLHATAMRRGELAGLDVGDVDLDRALVRIRRGKGGRSRIVPLGRRAAAWVRHYIDRARLIALKDVRQPALFLSRRGRRVGVKTVTARMHACLRRAGVAKGGSCHIIRHSVATLMHEAGADIRDLQALLGHSLLTSTQLYTRVSMQHLQAVHRRTHPSERWPTTGFPPD
ncbi:MAG: tyrosine-type recombinase/integrase [Gemmatimonadaceae bacterium]|nr:tyrosine-type recombinase/integrase [Gemmatimonadaceae bacterium]